MILDDYEQKPIQPSYSNRWASYIIKTKEYNAIKKTLDTLEVEYIQKYTFFIPIRVKILAELIPPKFIQKSGSD